MNDEIILRELVLRTVEEALPEELEGVLMQLEGLPRSSIDRACRATRLHTKHNCC